MTDQAAVLAKPIRPAMDGQLAAALTIIICLTILGLALIVAGIISIRTNHPENAIWLGIGAIAGSLGTALSAPTGIANVIKAAGGNGQS